MSQNQQWPKEGTKIVISKPGLDGEVEFSYKEEVSLTATDSVTWLRGIIPPHILEQGKETIHQYIRQRVEDYKAGLELSLAQEKARLRDLHREVLLVHHGIFLQGEIVSFVDGTMTVRSKSPYSGEKTRVYEGIESIAVGARLDPQSLILAGGALVDPIQDARQLLKEIFDEEFYKPHGFIE